MKQNRNSSNVYWVLMDADNPYRVAYYGGYDEDPSLPYMTSLSEAICYPDYKSARKAANAIFDKHERGFFEVPVTHHAPEDGSPSTDETDEG